jgi:methylmalonyl-CoA/ethylmalonyl-CoA epimerase
MTRGISTVNFCGVQPLHQYNLMTPSSPRGPRISHVGIALEALGDALPFFRDVLGLGEVRLEDADGARIVGFSAGESLVELLEGENPSSPITRFVAKRGPGIHHICFSVDDLDAMLERCRAAGIQLIDQTPRIGAEGKRIAFLHPKSTGGVLVELSDH